VGTGFPRGQADGARIAQDNLHHSRPDDALAVDDEVEFVFDMRFSPHHGSYPAVDKDARLRTRAHADIRAVIELLFTGVAHAGLLQGPATAVFRCEFAHLTHPFVYTNVR
jgi:hypothetical protein